MNGRQAAKLAAQRIMELEHYNRLCAADITVYNQVILGMIEHKSPCDWCQDQEECRGEGKDLSIGCDMWMLKDQKVEQEAVEPFHRCIGKEFSLIEDSHFDYCPYCGKPITWAKQEGR